MSRDATEPDGHGETTVDAGPVIELSEEALRVILDEGRRRYPEECCGGLLGREPGPDRRRIEIAVPVGNEQEEMRERRYLVGPREVMRLEDQADREGLLLLGFFHSHPDHPAEASETDRELAWPWYSYMILSVHQGEPKRLRSWRLVDDRSTFEEEAVNGMEGAIDQS